MHIAHVHPTAHLLQVAHHAARRVQAKGAAAGQNDGVHPLHQIAGAQQIRFPCAGGRAADAHAADGPFLPAQHHRHAGLAPRALGMAHADTVYVCNISRIVIH